MAKYSVTLEKIINDKHLEVLYVPRDTSAIYITSKHINRPGLILSGYEDFFENDRIQIVGLSEISYLSGLPILEKQLSLERFFEKHPAAVLISRNLEPLPEFLNYAKKYEVPILRTSEMTTDCMATMITYLGVELAERITRHGVLVEVYGEGILIVGDSGIGKSETAVELIKRGHRLIADDAVEIRKVSSTTLVGQAPDNIRHYIEVRGIGIINASRIFGMGAVKTTENINMIIQLEPWDSEKIYDRLGLEEEYITILGIKVPAIVVPVKPGRNLAIIIETAAMNNRQKKMGYNAANELMKNLGIDDFEPESEEIQSWDE